MSASHMLLPLLTVALTTVLAGNGAAQVAGAAWLDNATLPSWNTPRSPIPTAVKSDAAGPRCRDLARPVQLAEDRRLSEKGWDLVGPYQGGWETLVIAGTSAYDGMCRPRQYQYFIFVRGVFAGTLSPRLMDSRTDGAITRVALTSRTRLSVEYARYASADPLCCPSRMTEVTFELQGAPAAVRPLSRSTSSTGAAVSAAQETSLTGQYWRAVELAGKAVPRQNSAREAHLQFQEGERVSGSDGCNRIMGSYHRTGDRITFGQLAGTRMACMNADDTERPFRDALNKAARFVVSGNRMELFDGGGTRLAAFVLK